MEINHLNPQATVTETTDITSRVSEKITNAAIADQYLTDETTKMDDLSSEMSDGLGTPKGKALSDLYQAADMLRDNLLFVLITLVKGFAAWDHAPTNAAAKQINTIVKAHGTEIAKKSYEMESALLTSLLNDLSKPEANAALATLGLTDLVAELKAAQQTFVNITAQSATLEAAKDDKPAPSSLRKQTISSLNAIIDYLNLMGRNASRKAIYAPLAAELAVMIDATNLKISNRMNSNTSEDKKEEK
jgi:hypothetical protein